jgi:hypothetical protein
MLFHWTTETRIANGFFFGGGVDGWAEDCVENESGSQKQNVYFLS